MNYPLSLTLIYSIFHVILAVPIDYDGTSEVTFNSKDKWSIKYGVGKNCAGGSTIELTIDVTKVSAEADLILGFGTETKYFAIFNAYDGGMCVPCSGNTQSGTLFVTPPRGSALRSPDAGKTTTTQYGATTNSLGARVALVNSQDQTAQWDNVVGVGSNIGKNASPITLTIVQDIAGGSTTLTVNKNGVTTSAINFASTFGINDDLFLFLGIDDANSETFKLSGITSTNQCNPDGPIDYDGTSEVVLDEIGDWSAIYTVGESCAGRGLIELEIDLIATSSEADIILGFGTEQEYFVLFNAYDGGMCIPCSGTVQSGTLFVTPPQGEVLRTADTTTTAQFGATTDTANRARKALINNGNINAEWDEVVDTGSDIGKNASPMNIRITTSAGSTIVSFTKNGVTSPDIEFSSTFPGDEELKLFIGIDDWNNEKFILSGITQIQNQCEECDACANKDRLDALEDKVDDVDDKVDALDGKVDDNRDQCDDKVSTLQSQLNTKIGEVNDKIDDVNARIDKLVQQLNGIYAAKSPVFNQDYQIRNDGDDGNNITFLLSNTDILVISLIILTIFTVILSVYSCWRNRKKGHKYSKVDFNSNSEC